MIERFLPRNHQYSLLHTKLDKAQIDRIVIKMTQVYKPINEYNRSLRVWKHDYLKKNRSLDDVMEELTRLTAEYWKTSGQERPNHVWLTKPPTQPPAHLAVFFERWDVLDDFLNYEDGTHIHPFHRNKFGETIVDILHHIKAHERTGIARRCYERVIELRKRFCPNHNSVLCLGNYCPECKDTVVCPRLVQEPQPKMTAKQKRNPLRTIQKVESNTYRVRWVQKRKSFPKNNKTQNQNQIERLQFEEENEPYPEWA